MAPRIDHTMQEGYQSDHSNASDGVFSSERFTLPMKMQLEATMREPLHCSSGCLWGNNADFCSGKRQRRIRFDHFTRTINPDPEYYTEQDMSMKWFAAMELREFKVRAKELSNALRKSNKSQDQRSITVAHRKTTLMLKSDFKSLTKLSPSTPDLDITRWCLFSDGRRGLERFASQDYAVMRQSDIRLTRQAVLTEHARQVMNEEYDDEAVAKAAREVSRRARTFARFFGAADANVANRDEQSERRSLARCHSEAVTRPSLPSRKRSKMQL
jgi:hypothetical protein